MKIIVLLLICLNAFAGPVKLEGVESYQVVFFDMNGYRGPEASDYDSKKRKLVKSKTKFPELRFYTSPEMKGAPYIGFTGYNIYEDGKLICSKGLLCKSSLFNVSAYKGAIVFMHFKFEMDEASQKYFVDYKGKKLFFELSSSIGYKRVFRNHDLTRNEGSSSKFYRIYEPQSKVIANFSKKYPGYAKQLAHYKKCARTNNLKCFFSSNEDEKQGFLIYISPLREWEPLNITSEQLAIHYENFKKDKKHFEIILDALRSSSLRSYSQMDDKTYSDIDSISFCGKKTWSIEGNTLRTCYNVIAMKKNNIKAQDLEFYLITEDVNRPEYY